MKNTNAYAYRVYHSPLEDKFNTFTTFLFITNDKAKCEDYIAKYINEETETEKHEDDEGNIVNWWWKFTKVEEIEIKNDVYSVVVL